MFNLKKITQLNWTKVASIGLVLGIIVSSILKNLTPNPATNLDPNQDQIEQRTIAFNYDGTQSSFENITYTGQPYSNPKQLGVYQVKSQKTIFEKVLKSAINKYQFELVSEFDQHQVYENPEYKLSANKLTEVITVYSDEPPAQKTNLDVQSATNTAQEILLALLPEQVAGSLQPLLKEAKYLQGEHHLEEVGLSSANIVHIPFAYTLEEYPVYFNDEIQPPISMMIDSNNTMIKTTVQLHDVDFSLAQTEKILSVIETVKNINDNYQGVFIEYTKDTPMPPKLNNISKGELREAQLEYRLNSETKTVTPYYRFSGLFEDGEGSAFKGILLTPATYNSL